MRWLGRRVSPGRPPSRVDRGPRRRRRRRPPQTPQVASQISRSTFGTINRSQSWSTASSLSAVSWTSISTKSAPSSSAAARPDALALAERSRFCEPRLDRCAGAAQARVQTHDQQREGRRIDPGPNHAMLTVGIPLTASALVLQFLLRSVPGNGGYGGGHVSRDSCAFSRSHA